MGRTTRVRASVPKKYTEVDSGDVEEPELENATLRGSHIPSQRKVSKTVKRGGKAKKEPDAPTSRVEGDNVENSDGTPEAEDVQPKKKAKIAESTSTKRKGRVGKLQYFKEMPLDIFYEICGHLDPLTLLYLARTCKNLRSMFMSKRAVGIWEETLANVSFPPLAAKDTSLPMYASLAFEIHCHVCGVGGGHAKRVNYILGVRLCRSCQKKNLLYELALKRVTGKLHPDTLDCCRYTPYSLTGFSASGRKYYFLPQVEVINKYLVQLDAESKKSRSRMDYERFVQVRTHAASVALDDGSQLAQWEKAFKDQKADKKADLTVQRKRDIKQKLRDLGYEEQDIERAYISPQPTPLTDRSWNLMRASLIKQIDTTKARRLEYEAENDECPAGTA